MLPVAGATTIPLSFVVTMIVREDIMQTATATEVQVKRDRLLRLPEVLAVTGCGKTTIYVLMARGEFPRQVSITPRVVAWAESEVLRWMQERIAAAVSGSRRPGRR